MNMPFMFPAILGFFFFEFELVFFLPSCSLTTDDRSERLIEAVMTGMVCCCDAPREPESNEEHVLDLKSSYRIATCACSLPEKFCENLVPSS
jgi:hypothetical protein